MYVCKPTSPCYGEGAAWLRDYILVYRHATFIFLQFATNTFQGILIGDSISSYAVFIYDCGSMGWGGGVIGWQDDFSQYNSHYLSGESDSNDIGCLYSNSYSAVVFKIDDGK